ncbi:MAG TPA: peptidoglycan-associated lipoprotein Pal [Bryobacteraceae bacterium]|nr:peptidoglycan-associated lipoprotein Pal [Bryobacteraceae bacterium]
MRKCTLEIGRTSGVLLASILFLFAAGCHKKAPAPPPPPPAAQPTPPPAPSRPSIDSFTAEPSTIERGQSSTLRWSVSNATDTSIDQGLGAVQSSGSRQVFPSSTTTYTLTAKGAGGTDSRQVTVEVTVPPPPPPPPPPTVKRSASDILASDVHDAYFDFDKYDIRSDAQQVLTQDAGVLKQIFQDNPSFTVVVEGHCDERGSAEYNLGLGDKRATAAKDFLVQLGVPADRMKTISYGKERPVCTDQTEECYQRNRHVHFSPAQ